MLRHLGKPRATCPPHGVVAARLKDRDRISSVSPWFPRSWAELGQYGASAVSSLRACSWTWAHCTTQQSEQLLGRSQVPQHPGHAHFLNKQTEAQRPRAPGQQGSTLGKWTPWSRRTQPSRLPATKEALKAMQGASFGLSDSEIRFQQESV